MNMNWNPIDSIPGPPYTDTILFKGTDGCVIAGYKELDETYHELDRDERSANHNELRTDWVAFWSLLPKE
jgi:hypothetical protein